MGLERRLAAILAADVVGYSRLMESDEAGTHSALNAHREELIDPKVAEHHGRIVKLTGDGALVEFASAVDAVECAAAVQRGMEERTAQEPEDRRIKFRIGINIGDIIVEESDIYGDGVNVAARLESVADPGGICIARNVFNQVKNKVDLGFEDLGEHRVKNIAEPVPVYRVHLDAGAVPKLSEARRRLWRREALVAAAIVAFLIAGLAAWNFILRPSDGPREVAFVEAAVLALPSGPSIAVLPFANLSGSLEQEYFSDGITEEIITALTRYRELHVRARSATTQYKGQAIDPRQIGQDLDVAYVLKGSIRRASDTIRVTAQLIDTTSAALVWAESYEADLTPANVFNVQAEITEKVVNAIASSYGGAIAKSRLAHARGKPPQSLSAYECVLTARQWIRSPSESNARRAYDCLKPTVELDPNYAHAWALLAYVYAVEYAFEFGLAQAEGGDPRALALEAARRAVELDPGSAEASWALTRAYLVNGDLEKFYDEAERTLLLSPNDITIGVIGSWIGYTGKWEKGKALVRKAIALYPKTYPKYIWYVFAKDHYRKGEYEAALDYFHRAFIPGFWLAQLQYAYTYGWLDDEAKASAAVAKLLELRPGYAIENAVHFYRAFGFQPSYIDRMVEGLRRAGLPERSASAELPSPE
ncbi:MAG: adenylate/guanylate cyclase domain-containing protein [Kiloniellales bacterium]|nr:adenylate/guanylate cyclase domain-containing protein [Kiloniellales bacterium]